MRTLASLACLALIACGSTADPADADPFDLDAGPPQFEVRLERSEGIALADGDELDVHYGCQGGAHVMLDVVAIGEGMRNAQVTVQALDREPLTLTMTETATGADFRHLMYILADFVAPRGLGLPRDEVVRVSVRRRDGARVVLERTLRFVDGELCMVMCTYEDVPGTARVTALDGPGTSGCEPGDVGITFDFTPDAGTGARTGLVMRQTLPFDCLAAMGLSVGAEIPAVERALVPGTGTCTPFFWDLLLDRDACAAACPGP